MAAITYTAEEYAEQIEQVILEGEDVTTEAMAIGIYSENREGGRGWVDLVRRDTEGYIVSAGEFDPRPAIVRREGVVKIVWKENDEQETD